MYVLFNAPYQVVYISDLSHYWCYKLSALDEGCVCQVSLLQNYFFHLQIASYWNHVHISILIKLSINSLIYISKDPWYLSLFSGLLSGIIIIYLMFKLFPIWPVGTLSNWIMCPLTCLHHSLSISLLSGHLSKQPW